MADDGQGLAEALKNLAVSVAKHHLVAVPERVVIVASVVDGGVERAAGAVDRRAAVGVAEQVVGCTQSVVGLVHGWIGRGRGTFRPHRNAGQILLLPGIEDGAAQLWRERGARSRDRRGAALHPGFNYGRLFQQRPLGRIRRRSEAVRVFGYPGQQIGRDYGAGRRGFR